MRESSPALAGDAGAAGGVDHVGHPVTADVGRVEPLEGQDPPALRPMHRLAQAVEARLQASAQRHASRSVSAGVGERDQVVQDLAEALGIE